MGYKEELYERSSIRPSDIINELRKKIKQLEEEIKNLKVKYIK